MKYNSKANIVQALIFLFLVIWSIAAPSFARLSLNGFYISAVQNILSLFSRHQQRKNLTTGVLLEHSFFYNLTFIPGCCCCWLIVLDTGAIVLSLSDKRICCCVTLLILALNAEKNILLYTESGFITRKSATYPRRISHLLQKISQLIRNISELSYEISKLFQESTNCSKY